MKTSLQEIKTIIQATEIQSGLLLAIIDEEGTIHSANARLQRLLHMPSSRYDQRNIFDLVHPSDYESLQNGIRTCKNQGSPYSIELHVKNGYYHPLRWQVYGLSHTIADKAVFLCVGTEKETTDHKNPHQQSGVDQYQLVIESMNEGVFIQDAAGEIISMNERAADILGTTTDRIRQLQNIKNLWKTAWKITTEEGRDIAFEETPFMKALRSGVVQDGILRIHYHASPERLVSVKSKPLFNPGDQLPFSVVSSVVDVTQQHRLASKMKEQEALFHSFMKHSPNLAWVIDEEEKLVFANQAFRDHFHLQDSVMDQAIVPYLPKSVINALYKKHKDVLATGKAINTLQEMELADGSTFMFHVNIFPIEGLTGKKMIGGHAINLAEKYAVEKELREAHDRLLLLTRATSDAVWEWDMRTGHIFRNEKLMEMIGYQQYDSQGLAWWFRRIHPEDRDRVSDKVKDVTDNALHSWEDEYRFKCADGIYKQIHDKGFVVYENGLPVKMIGTLHDVSEIRELQEKLLEEKKQRQKEISEIMISVQEQERTKIAYELHDNVNQILSAAKLFIDLLKTRGKEQREIRDKGAAYLNMAIEEIRKLSKEMVAPQLKGKGLIQSIQALVDDIHFTNAIRIQFFHECETELLSSGKTITLFRIVQEQLKNILKYSQATDADIRLYCRSEMITLVVADNGRGFDPRQTGRGIGLSNIYERARFYHGTVDLETAPGKGCVLTVMMPLK
jgi:PAS domain S-box-containing protein